MDIPLLILAIPDGYPPVNFIVTLNGEEGELEPPPQDEEVIQGSDLYKVVGAKRKKVVRASVRSLRPWDRTEDQNEEPEQGGSPNVQTREGSLELLAKQGFSLYEKRDRELLKGLPEPYPSDYDIVRWGRATQNHMRRGGYMVSREALKYWVKYFFDPSQERERWEYVCERIDQLF